MEEEKETREKYIPTREHTLSLPAPAAVLRERQSAPKWNRSRSSHSRDSINYLLLNVAGHKSPFRAAIDGILVAKLAPPIQLGCGATSITRRAYEWGPPFPIRHCTTRVSRVIAAILPCYLISRGIGRINIGKEFPGVN